MVVQAVAVVALILAVQYLVLVVLEILHQHRQVKETMVALEQPITQLIELAEVEVELLLLEAMAELQTEAMVVLELHPQ
ncbi:MAG: hypothetical protein EBQ92_01005 [Proteobacteria bacterium]|nr:hypothetical protein [Pseudomonadota bacterium]